MGDLSFFSEIVFLLVAIPLLAVLYVLLAARILCLLVKIVRYFWNSGG